MKDVFSGMLIHYLPQTVTALSIDVRSNPFKDDVQYWRSVAENLFERNNMKEMKLKSADQTIYIKSNSEFA